MRIAIGPHVDVRAADYACAGLDPAACMILSRVLGISAPMLTGGAAMFSILREALAAAPGCAPVLIDGETGVGKKSLARIIHAASGDAAEPIYIDCAAHDRSSEAFMDQLDAEAASGIVEHARRTIILDRIGELTAANQSRLSALMRRIEHRGVARFIGIAGRSLIGIRRRGEFSAELRGMFDAALTLPPLRRRRKDIPLLAQYFLHGISAPAMLDAGAMRALRDYPFPGNVRELRNLVTRLAILAHPADAENRGAITQTDVRNQLAGLYRAAGTDSIVWKLTPERGRRGMAAWALAAAAGNRAEAAVSLGVEPAALSRLTATAAKARGVRRGRA